MGKTRADVMPKLAPNEIMAARLNDATFTMLNILILIIKWVFLLGDVLMSGRLLGIGMLATYDRLRKVPILAGPDYKPAVTVIVPAYNEEKVIEQTVRSVLASDYPNLHTIVVDDGSSDRTTQVVEEKFARRSPMVEFGCLTKTNAGKADSLNYALKFTDDEIYVGIDADTVIAPNAISLLVPHFADPERGRGGRQCQGR